LSSTITKHRWQVKGKNVPNVELETKRQNLLIGEHRKVSPRHGSLASASICYLSAAEQRPTPHGMTEVVAASYQNHPDPSDPSGKIADDRILY